MQAFRSKLAHTFAVLLALATLSSLATAPQRTPTRDKAHTNAAGQTVKAANGQRINYRREELKRAPPPARPELPASAVPTGQLASWSWASLGSGIGMSGMPTSKVGDNVELYASGSQITFGLNSYWYALRWNRNTAQFDVTYVSDQLQPAIVRIVLARTAAVRSRDQRSRIVVGLADGTLRRYDQLTKTLLSSTAGPCATRGGLQALTAADLNGDGGDELLSVCGDGTFVAEDERGSAWFVSGVGGTEIVVGQMDDDPALEIATTSGRVLDSATRSVQWQHFQAFGNHLQLADIDGDGRDELIASEGWYWVWAFDVERQLPKWSLRADLDIGAILMADIDGDGVKDLLVGDGQWGSVSAYDPVTLQRKGNIANPEHGVTQIAVADLDGDGKPELMWGAGASSTGPDHLYVADWPTRQIRWQNPDLVGPFVGPVVGDLDGDGIPEIVMASFESDAGYASGRILVFDSRTMALRAVSQGISGGTFSWSGLHDLKLRDIDGDGRLEILVAADWLYAGVIEAYRFGSDNQFALVWTNATRPASVAFHSVEVADVDGDGRPDILGGVGTGGQGSFVYAYDNITGAEKWHTLHLGGTIHSLVLGDFDGNGILDFAAGVQGGPVYVFNAPGHGLDALINVGSSSLTRLATAPIPRLIVGLTNGRASVRAFDGGTSYPEVQGLQLGNVAVDGISVGADGSWWVGIGGQLKRLSGATPSFTSASYGALTGIHTVPGPAGGPTVLTTGSYGMHGFTVAP